MEVVFKGSSCGKLMLTGEYLALCGAKTLALPTQMGQSIMVSTQPGQNFLHWKAILSNQSTWFEATFLLPSLRVITCTEDKSAQLIATLLKESGYKFKKNYSYNIETKLDFDPAWGLGSSSTLIANIANFTKTNAFKLLDLSFKGSGYDVAVGLTNSAIVFEKNANPQWQTINYNPPFSNDVLFVYSGKKRVSRDAIKSFDCSTVSEKDFNAINSITEAFITCQNINKAEELIAEHESIIGSILRVEPIKKELFSDFAGGVKSLGAWGGDFLMATRKEEAIKYFTNKGYTTMFNWNEIIKL